MSKNHGISSDKRMNKQLKEDIQGLRGGMLSQAEKNELPSRFSVKPHEDSPAMVITDTETNKQTIVSLFAYGEVRKALNNLF